MDLDELFQKYKYAKPGPKIAAIAVLALIIPPLLWFGDYSLMSDEITQKGQTKEILKLGLNEALKKRADLPKLVQEFEITKDQLQQAKRALPDFINFEEILQKVATLAQDANVVIQLFDPAETPTIAGSTVKFLRHDTKIEVAGQFNQIAGFLDQIARIQTSVFINNLKLMPYSTTKAQGKDAGADANSPVILKCEFVLAVHRSMSIEEETAIQATPNKQG